MRLIHIAQQNLMTFHWFAVAETNETNMSRIVTFVCNNCEAHRWVLLYIRNVACLETAHGKTVIFRKVLRRRQTKNKYRMQCNHTRAA